MPVPASPPVHGRQSRASFVQAQPLRWPVSGLAGRFHRLPRPRLSANPVAMSMESESHPKSETHPLTVAGAAQVGAAVAGISSCFPLNCGMDLRRVHQQARFYVALCQSAVCANSGIGRSVRLIRKEGKAPKLDFQELKLVSGLASPGWRRAGLACCASRRFASRPARLSSPTPSRLAALRLPPVGQLTPSPAACGGAP